MERLQCGLGEVKFAGSDGDMTFSGYGAVFGNLDSYGDMIAKGAFRDTLAAAKKSGNWPAMMENHGPRFGGGSLPVGVWTDLREDDSGLYVEGKLAPTPRGQEIYALMKMAPRPAINGLSIGYQAKEWAMRTKADEPRRTLKAVDVFEISITPDPANDKARIGAVKSIATIREFEDFLRDVGGYSHAAAKAIAASGFKANADPRDEDDGQLANLLRRNIQKLNP